MKCLIYSDVHWSTFSSIIRQRGNKYSLRLEMLIKSLNWINELAINNSCEMIFCAGDFMHKPQLNDEELTALREISWENVPQYFLCGNHESSVNNLQFSSVKSIEGANRYIIDSPQSFVKENIKFSFIPYISEATTSKIGSFIEDVSTPFEKHIIISHNDIQGIKYGVVESTTGFEISDIEQNCDLYLNGHIHNCEWITNKILNVGSLSGHNFTNDALKYQYGAWILDTDTLKLTFIENPFGFNFYKLNICSESDLRKILLLKPNSLLSVSCDAHLLTECCKLLQENKNLIEFRVLIGQAQVNPVEDTNVDLETPLLNIKNQDYLEKLKEFCYKNIEASEILTEELLELTR